MLKIIQEYIKSFSHLFYPELCLGCQENDREIEDAFCLECYANLPFTNQANIINNEFINHFNGKINIEHGAALFYFVKQGMVQEIIQQLKYLNKPQYGIKMGEIFGKIIKNSTCFKSIDAIIPVPLHKKKEQERGYNQSNKFAQGLSNSLNIPFFSNNLIRVKYTSTQTKMNREERILNLNSAFMINNPEFLEGKHLLLIDDVLTTGATLLECALQLKTIKGVKISMATIGMGEPV
jgi:ComF family protein